MDTTKPNSKKAHVIRGIPVEFPYEPYGSQLGFMNRVISTLDRALTEGHCHGLLESPTGTGKSLSLLCSSLAWQKNFKSKNLYANLSHSKPAPEAVSDPLGHGGGFIPEAQTQRTSAHGDAEPGAPAANGKNQKKKTCPTIFYATRTHSQVSQVIREYRKTAYRVPMTVLASRKHYCTNTNVQGRTNLDEECKMLVKNRDMGCSEYKNMHKVKGHPTVQKGGCYEAHDIEDLVKIGQMVKGCPYYAARSMADDAQLVFCPYSYIINPVIRGAMEVDIKGAVVIFDEAHNIEDIARDAGSVDLEEDVLDKLQIELLGLCERDREIYQPLFEMTRDITDWMRRRKKSLEKREFQHYFSCWTGDNALRELQEAADISPLRFPVLLECARKAIKAATDMESDGCHLNGMGVLTLEGLFSSLSYFFSGNSLHILDYQLALQRYVKRDGNSTGNWTYTLSLWCLNPAVVFREIADLSLSVILTSGTLSPVNSFSSELGVQFGTCLEAQHVVDVDLRLWAAVISRGPANYQLNASYKTSDGYAFQDALGKSIEEICKIAPDGALIFFPSYKFMEKMRTRWCETGQWSRLNAQKPLFVEPRGGTQDDFESILKSYYKSIHCGSKPAFGRKKKGKKLDWNNPYGDSGESSKKGAAFLAVCRGKVSEGIDFSDENARLVIIVGIPFPNINDIQVAQKKKYNDAYKSSKNLISGNEWYCYQAFRALNQAAGRCLRHRYDYGAIILLDERFQEERNTAYISKWLKKSIRQYDNFEKSLEGLKSFFRNAKEQFDMKPVNILPDSDNHVKYNSYKNREKEHPRMKNQKLNNFDPSGLDISNEMIPARKSAPLSQSFTSSPKYEATSPVSLHQQSHGNDKSQPLKDEKDIDHYRVYIDLDCSPQRASRCSKATSAVSPYGSQDVSIVKETTDINDFMSPGSLCKDENSSTTFGGASPQIQGQLNQPSGVSPTATCSEVVTPDEIVDGSTCHFEPDTEASLNLSVNSYAQKRRKFIRSSLLDQVHDSDAARVESPGHVYCSGSMMTKDASHSIEFGVGALQKCEKENGSQLIPQNDDSSSSGSAPELDKKLQIYCKRCRNSLGLPENHSWVTCSLSTSSKVHLSSLKGNLAATRSSGIPILISDTSSINQKLFDRRSEDGFGQGVWCENDGCVYNTIYCPFCSVSHDCLGVKVVATDASNINWLHKVLLYMDSLEIKNLETSHRESSVCHSDCGANEVLSSFSYKSPQNSSGWSTRSKLRLPRRAVLSDLDA